MRAWNSMNECNLRRSLANDCPRVRLFRSISRSQILRFHSFILKLDLTMTISCFLFIDTKRNKICLHVKQLQYNTKIWIIRRYNKTFIQSGKERSPGKETIEIWEREASQTFIDLRSSNSTRLMSNERPFYTFSEQVFIFQALKKCKDKTSIGNRTYETARKG